jgi:hypothetical protein
MAYLQNCHTCGNPEFILEFRTLMKIPVPAYGSSLIRFAKARQLHSVESVTQYDISVILPFQDHEEIIGRAVAAVAGYLRDQGAHFEILAVDDDSGDNSQAVLALIRASFPELRVLGAPGRGRGHELGARQARGAVLWFIEPGHAVATLAQFAQAHERIRRGEKDLIAVEQGYVVVHRARCWKAVKGVRGLGRQFRRRLLWRASRCGLQIDIPGPRRMPAPRWAAPLVAALSVSRGS